MRCTTRGLVAALIICIITGLAGAACGQPQSSSATSDGPKATATALFVNTNRKLALGGEPTLRPGTDPLHPFAQVTFPPLPTYTPGPSPTPLAPACGATILGWDQILKKYGGFYKGNGCGVYQGQVVIATEGVGGGPGAIATYVCEATDASCLKGSAPEARGAAWSVFPAPYPGGVEISVVGDSSPSVLILVGGRCFNLSTHKYDLNPACH